jgi:6-phosphogluconolactonase (cycloisomerase 2 family)
MKKLLKFWVVRAAGVMVCVLGGVGFAVAGPQYVITNDDPGVSFYAVARDGTLKLQRQVQIGGFGTVAGFFGANRIVMLNSKDQQCVYASVPSLGEVVGIAVGTLTIGGSASGSGNDNGAANGIGLAVNGSYLYASFADSNTIATFQVMAGCGVAFVNDIAAGGLAGGLINGMAIHGNFMITSFTDGSIESFNISAGVPVSNGDEQYSSATLTSQDSTYPNAIDITSDGHFAIFGDTSTLESVEVSDISSGKLGQTVVHKSKASISASNVILSPDETLLYVINTQGDTVSAYNFDKTTGKLSGGCISGPIRGQSANWSYLAGPSLISTSGNGGGVYVAEFGGPSAIAMVRLTSSGKKCSLQESTQSPFADPDSQGLLSIGMFPPRAF